MASSRESPSRRLASITVIALGILCLLAAPTIAQDKQCPNAAKANYPAPVVADGWSYRLIATGLTRPRGIIFDDAGALLVVDAGVGVYRYTFTDHGGTCLDVSNKTLLVKNAELGHGIALSPQGKSLVASTTDDVIAWEYDSSVGTIGRNWTLVTNMTNSGHSSRTLLMSRTGRLIVSRGSAGNIDPLALDKATGHCQIRTFDVANVTEAAALDFGKDGHLLGWGLRNSVGVAEHPIDGGIWSVENSVDNLQRRGEDIHNDNPAEELNYHGTANGTAEGANYGYPVCFAVWGTDGFPDRGNLTTGDQFAVDANATIVGNRAAPSDEECNSNYKAPVLAFQAHTAPLDIKFDKNGTTAYVSFHGSWNRAPPVGYDISAIQFSGGHPSVSSDSMDAVKAILSNKDLTQCPSKCFRPVGLAWDSKDRLWFSSDSTGELLVLLKGKDQFAPVQSGSNGAVGHAGGLSFSVVAVAVFAVLFALL